MKESLKEFTLYKVDEPIFITLRNTTITFSKRLIEVLDYPEYIHLLIDSKGKRIALEPSIKDENSIKFYVKPKEGSQLLIRLGNKAICQELMNIAGIEDCGKGLRFTGKFIEEDNIVIIDLKK